MITLLNTMSPSSQLNFTHQCQEDSQQATVKRTPLIRGCSAPNIIYAVKGH
jgi:hypothetical protein